MAGERRNSAHGKEAFRWCDSCGTLLLGGSCSACGSEGREFEVNSPGDIRPCMGDSVGIVKGLFEEAFGTSSPLDGAMMFLNKVPGEDRTDEIIAYGAVLGILRFDMRLDRLVLEIRQPGADLFAPVAKKNIVTFAGMSGHLKGKTVPGANVTEVVGDFREGETLILRKAAKVGAGIALTDSSSIWEAERAVKIRDLDNPSEPHIARCSINGFIESNRSHIKSIAKRGVKEIRTFLAEKNPKGLPVTVSFSGGKDSLAAYGLASQAAEGLELINIDTGLEFPETLEYVRSFAEKNKLKIHTARGGNGFWDNVDTFGPPAKDFRWCCKVCKLGPVTDLISETYPDGTVTVEGNRWLESFARSGIGFVTRNPFVPNQINLNPIRSWNAAEVWGYILMFGLDYNPLYDRDFERIGCYLCPSCLSSEWRNTGRIHPELYDVWEAYLRRYAESRGLPEEYASMGFWRWKVLPPKMVLLAEGLDLRMAPESASNVSMDMLKGASPCTAGGYSMEAVVKMERVRDFSYVEDALRTVGEVKYSPEFEIALLKLPNGRAKLFGGGQVSVTAPDAKNARLVFERAVKALIRAEMCTECGICEKGCARHAIRIKGGMRVDPERCNSCGRCEKSCMVIHYYDKLMQGPKDRAFRTLLFIIDPHPTCMDLMFGVSMVLGIGPALALMWIVMKKYTYPAVEQPFFSDATFFLLFFVGLIIGSVLFAVMIMFHLASSMVYMILLAAIQVMVMVVVMNLKRFRGKSDSIFYGYGLGLGMSCGMSMGIAYTITSLIKDIEVDASVVILLVIAVTMSMMLGACGTTIGEGIARNRLQEFIFQALLFLVAYDLMFYSVLNTGADGGLAFYGSCILMCLLAGGYFYYMMHLKLRNIIREVLRMEGKKRSDLRIGPCISLA